MKISELDQAELTLNIEKALTAITDFLEVGIEYDYVVSSYQKETGEERELLTITIKGEHDSLLIGYHGQTLDKLQHLVSMSLSHTYKQPIRVVIDINDYRQKRINTIENLARRAEQQVIETGQALELQPMPPSDRRIVHQLLTTDGKVKTESIGEGRERRIIVKPV